MTTRKYSSRAQQTTLASSITSGDTSMTVVSGSNLMGGKTPAATETYTVVIDPDTANEEIVDVNTYTSGNTLTIVRARDGSTGVAHSAGAVVRHMVIGRDLQEANDHIEASTNVHGLAVGVEVVGRTTAQTLTNKTLTAPVIASIVNTGTLTLPTSTDTLIGKATSDTLTNKTFDTAGTGNSFSINGTAITTKTGTGSAVLSASPTLTGTAIATNLTASGTVTSALFSGPLTGAVTGNVTGNLTGNVTGNLTGTVTGTSTLDLPLSGGTMTGALTLSGAPTVGLHAATKTYVDGQISGLVNGATAAYDTLKELGDLIDTGDTAAAALTATVALKAPLASPTFTGIPAAPTAAVSTNTTQIATTAYVMAATVAPSNLTGPITSVGAATSITSQTGTGTKFVVDTSPTLVTPVLGVATATSINGTTIPSSVTLVKTSDTLAAHSSTTSAQLAGIISDKTGTGSLVFGTSPTLGSPALTTPTISTYTTAGDLVYGSGSGVITRLGIGSSTQVLTVAGGVPTWAAGGSAADDDQPILASQIFG